jgi:hypothetical protein
MEKYNNEYTCQTCFTTYLKKSTLQKHKILCEFSQFSKRERQTDIEEIETIPSHRELFKIVQQIFIENQNMKTKIKKMETFINTNNNLNNYSSNNKSSKKNMLEELNNTSSSNPNPTPIPSLSFDYWLEILLTDTDIITENILFLLESYSVQEVISIIISKQYYSNVEIDINNPIFVVNKKTATQHQTLMNGKNDKNDVFIWENEWIIMTEEKIQSVSKRIVTQLLKNILKWNIENSLKIRGDEKMGTLYMKIMNKLSSVPDNSHYTISILSLDIFKNQI